MRWGALMSTAALAAVFASPATAVPCGTIDPKTGATLKGTLTLDQEDAVTDAVFKRKTGHKTLALIFSVAGCELMPGAPAPALDVGPRRNTDELPDGAVAIKRVVSDASTLEVDLDADTSRFDPGAYGALVTLRAPYLVTSRTPVSVSRSESNLLIPLAYGAVSALVAVALDTLRHLVQRQKPKVGLGLVVAVFAAGAAAGAVLALVSWGSP